MELRHLRYFVAVARELSFTKAAQKLRVAQPALSRQIQDLEEELGVTLLQRDRRSTHLTDAGRVFLAEACALLEQAERAVQAARQSAATASAKLNVGYVWGLFHSVAPEAIGRFRQLFPDAAVNLFDLTGMEQVHGLLEGKLDVGLVGFEDEATAPGLARRKVGRCAFVAALPARHPAARRSSIPLRQLERAEFIMVSDEAYPGAARIANAACLAAGFKPKVRQTVERGYTALGLVAAEGGVALLPESLRNLPHPGVVFRPLADPPRADLFIAWKASKPHAARDAFVNLFREEPQDA